MQTMRPDVAAFLKGMEESGAPPLNALPIADARAMLAGLRDIGDAEPTVLAVVRDIAVDGPDGVIPARLYDRRNEREASPLVVFYHGGGFVAGDLDTHEPFCTYLADRIDLPVLAIDYRLAPEHPFPAAPDDAEAAARWAAGGAAGLGFAVESLILCGDSAGGNLALVTGAALEKRPAAIPVVALWALYPVVGGDGLPSMSELADGYMLTKAGMDWFEELYGAPQADHRYACLLGPVATGPAILIHTAGLDPLRDQGRAYADKARAAGSRVRHIEADGMIHGFACMRRSIPSSLLDIDRFIDAARATLAIRTPG